MRLAIFFILLMTMTSLARADDRCPVGCSHWFDGCNTCNCVNGWVTSCTYMACTQQGIPRCVDPGSTPSSGASNNAVPPEWRGRDHTRRFDYPAYAGYRIDWCYTFGGYCGKTAADAYCRSIGYQDAIQWQIDENIGSSVVTRPMGDPAGLTCSGPDCDGFKAIWCQYRAP